MPRSKYKSNWLEEKTFSPLQDDISLTQFLAENALVETYKFENNAEKYKVKSIEFSRFQDNTSKLMIIFLGLKMTERNKLKKNFKKEKLKTKWTANKKKFILTFLSSN